MLGTPFKTIARPLRPTRALLACAVGTYLTGCAPRQEVVGHAPTFSAPRPHEMAHSSRDASGPGAAARLGAAGRGHAPVLAPVPPQLIHHFQTTQPLAALTFDACQTGKPARYEARIIKILRATRTPATLLLGGRWMETHPAVTRALGHDALFELGNHSYLHPHMTRITAARMRAELQQTQDIMYRLTGKQGTLFRPPYGEYDPTLVKVAAALGLRSLVWSVETGDPDPHESARSIIHTVTTQARPGSVIIMHVNGRGWHSAAALPTIIRRLRQHGFRFVTVSQALAVATPIAPLKSVVEHG